MLQWTLLDYLKPGQSLLLLTFFERGAIKEGGQSFEFGRQGGLAGVPRRTHIAVCGIYLLH